VIPIATIKDEVDIIQELKKKEFLKNAEGSWNFYKKNNFIRSINYQ
jgi:hypothetical protein